MKRASILALSVLILAVGALPAAAITRGELDGEGHPNVGLMVADVDGEPAWRCSGTLIAPRVFLTAGHCTYGATAARVWFDTDLTDNEEYPYGGETSYEGVPIPHPGYPEAGEAHHDVGLVILDEAVTDIEPASLSTPDLLDQLKEDGTLSGGYGNGDKADVYFRMVGYGRSLESWPPAELVSYLIRQVTESEYVSLTPVWLHLSQKAVFDESGVCFGDSGGPAFWVDPADPEGKEILVAVTSRGDGNCSATAFYSRVDTQEVREWILSQFP
jgi:secreted trypsin-like serine protease